MTTMMYEFVLYIIPIVLAMYNEFHLKIGFSTINVYDITVAVPTNNP